MGPLKGAFAADFPDLGCEQVFALAADIESYPHFLPWCRAARVLSRGRDAQGGEAWEVDNHFGAGPVDVQFRSHAVPEPPHRLEITAADGPFRAFRMVWRFTPLEGGGCRAEAKYSMDFHSPMLRLLAGMGAHEAGRVVATRFRARAEALRPGITSL